MNLEELCKQAHNDRIAVGMLDTQKKNEVLLAVAEELLLHENEILAANEKDMERAKENHMPQSLQDRLKLNHDRIAGMADGLCQIAKLDDPIGEVLSMKKRPNGLTI